MSKVCVAEVSADELRLHRPPAAHRLWWRPEVCAYYPATRHFVAWRGKQLVGLWLLPTRQDDRETGIREYRLLPYSAPWLAPGTHVKRRHVVQALFEQARSCLRMLSLPLEPGFADAAVMQQHGALLEWRHTHVLRSGWLASRESGKLGNRLRRSGRECGIRICAAGDSFRFDRAIVGETAAGLDRRSEMAEIMLARGEAFIVEATIGQPVGQALVMADRDRGYLFHAWSDPQARCPGVGSLLIHSALAELVRRGITELDLEGSVIERVDEFFCGLQADIVPYPSVHWACSGVDLRHIAGFDVATMAVGEKS